MKALAEGQNRRVRIARTNGAISKGNTLPKMARNDPQKEMSGFAPRRVNDSGATTATIRLQVTR